MKQEDMCSVVYALRILGKKWTPWILCELLVEDNQFFSNLLERVMSSSGTKISARVLSEVLTILEEAGIVSRIVEADTMPIRVRYSLTQKGRDFGIVLAVLKGWGIKWGGVEQKLCKSFRCVHNSVPMIDIDKIRGMLDKRPSEDENLE